MTAPVTPTITVREVLEGMPSDFPLRLLTGERGLDRKITIPRIQKLGLALAGFSHYIHSGRVQIVGQSEIQYLEQLSIDQRLEVLSRLPLSQITAVLITKNLSPPSEFLQQATQAELPVLCTPEVSSVAIIKMTEFLQPRLAPCVVLHGVMIELFGIGVLLQGESGIGKSECALDLIVRGNRLVSDDVVEVRRIGFDQLIGSAPEMMRNHMEIRGLGILNIKDLFGVSAITLSRPLDLVIRLERWEPDRQYDRLGLAEEVSEFLGKSVPLVRLPVTSGRNISTLVEVAVRNHLLKLRGFNAAQKFIAQHAASLGVDREPGER
ncbi:MAG: HPr(Ser) kinase/phosphatase [Acidobacteriota bacterium]